MALYRLGSYQPVVPDSAYVAREATLIGRVTLGELASVWPGAVIRADDEPIHVGERSNIQDLAVLHVDPGCPLVVGKHVTVGHQVVLHGCTIGDGSLVGIQAVVYNRAVIGRDCMIGAGSFVPEGKHFADRSLIVGTPARLVRELTDADVAYMHANTASYVARRERYKALVRLE